MTDNELKDECMENAEIDLRRYSNKELTQIREAMRIYADCKLKLFAIPDVVGRSEQFGCDGCRYYNSCGIRIHYGNGGCDDYEK